MHSVLSYIDQNQDRFLQELKAFLRIASISTDPAYKSDMLLCASSVQQQFIDIGLENVQVFPTEGHPIVYGEWLHAPGKPTVLFYGHYDVQPPDPLALWVSPPFEPTVREGQLYARGASDDKGQVWCHLKSIEAWLKTQGQLPVNVKVIIEGEEEIGSKHLFKFISEHTELLKSDVALVSDTPMIAQDVPSICFSLRGLVYLELKVTGCTSDLHSGQHGGAVPNPINALATIISKLKDTQNRVTIPGFYDDVLPISDTLHHDILALPHSDETYLKDLGAKALCGEEGFTTLERRWLRPTLDCNGIFGGYTGEGEKTVIASHATVKLSMRLVANQDPYKITKAFRDFLPSITPPEVTVEVKEYSGAFAARVNPEHPAIEAAKKALESAFGVPARLQGEGGTVPIVNEFEKKLGIQTVLMGLNLANDNIHAPNERFSLSNFYRGIKASAHFWKELGSQSFPR